MYTPIWDAVRKHLDAERMQADIIEFFEFSRWSSFDKIVGLAQCIAAKMEAIGMEDARLIEFPADGRTAHGGWMMPRAYDTQAARLTLLGAGAGTNAADTILADYHANPVSLMLYSLPTPPEGITAELVVADRPEDMIAERVSGRLVLTSGIGVEISQAAMRAGALGVVSDCRNAHRVFKNGLGVDTSNEWHNYTIAPWDDANKGFGFSLSPERGRELRQRLAGGQTLHCHAVVQTRHYDGMLPVVSGRLPGLEPDEIVLTGHYDEFGADDNCSQVAVALEVCRAIRTMLQNGEIPPLRRAVRVLLPMEVRGFNALIQNNAEIRQLRAGLNIDTVGTDQNQVTATCTLSDNFVALPSYAEEFAAELLARVAEENPLFRWRRADAETIDNIFGEPLIGAPTPSLWHFSATHHLATDTPDRISSRMLTDMARVTATYAAFLANAQLPEALWLSELVAEQANRRMGELAIRSLRYEAEGAQAESVKRQLESVYEQYAQKLASPIALVPSLSFVPCAELANANRQHLVGEDCLYPQEFFQARVSALLSQLERVRDETAARLVNDSLQDTVSPGVENPYLRGLRPSVLRTQNSANKESRPQDAWPQATETNTFSARRKASRRETYAEPALASRCFPLKTFRGFAAFENMNAEDSAYVKDVLGISGGWGAPSWVQNALMYANGKRTAEEIANLLWRHTGHEINVELLEQMFAFFAKRGMVRLRPYLTQAEIKAALEQAGIARGDVVLGHFALSRFGYIEGGAEGLIDTLLSIIGADGTLVMPTFTFSWIGRLPYDPQVTPSRVGAVTNCFWKRDGALRSDHPTHSFAAMGKHAANLLAGHDYTHSPLSPNSPLSRLADLDAKILLFSPPTTNTMMHVGEYHAGLPMQDYLCPILEGGTRREVVIPDCPWHVRFTRAYEKLYARGQVSDVALGEETVRTMRCRDAIDAQAEVMRETPEYLLQPGCDCPYCRQLKQCLPIDAVM